MSKRDTAPRGMSIGEWKVRCDLAALYRLVAHYRMTDLIYTHISARLPGAEHHFLINDYRRMFHEIRASDLVKIDLEGNKLDGDSQGVVNRAGFVIHSALHAAREGPHLYHPHAHPRGHRGGFPKSRPAAHESARTEVPTTASHITTTRTSRSISSVNDWSTICGKATAR